jgi:hypothetical protein
MTTARTIRVWLPEPGWVEAMGGLPGGMTADVWTGGEQLPDSAGEVEVVVLPFGVPGSRLPMLAKLPHLRLVQLMSAGAEHPLWSAPGLLLTPARGRAEHADHPAGPGHRPGPAGPLRGR